MTLPSLPGELLQEIWNNLDSFNDRNSLILTCRQMHDTFNNALYHRLVESKNESRKVMIWAALNGREICIRRLLECGVDPRFNDVTNTWEYRWADEYDYPMYHRDTDWQLEMTDMSHSTPLACAAQRGHTGIAELLIDAGVNVNAHGGWGDLPVIWAVGQDQAEVLSLLLAAGADAHLRIETYGTLLSFAVGRGHAEIVRLLLADDDIDSHWNLCFYTLYEIGKCLESAIRDGHENVVRVIIERLGPDINSLSLDPTPLYIAGEENSQIMVNLLLDGGAVDAADDDSFVCPLHRAILNDHFVTAVGLLDRGASTETRYGMGSTPLAAGVLPDYHERVNILTERDPKTQHDYHGDTPLLRAARGGLVRYLKLLVEKGADRTARDKFGYTPLCLAVLREHTEAVLALVGHDRDGDGHAASSGILGRSSEPESAPRSPLIDTPDFLNRTPLFLVTLQGNVDIVRLLLAGGSNAMQTEACSGRSPLSFADANKDKRFTPKQMRLTMEIISELLHNPSQATVHTLSVQNAPRPEQNTLDENDSDEDKSDGEAFGNRCSLCFVRISQYDEPNYCQRCGVFRSYDCFECVAAQRLSGNFIRRCPCQHLETRH